jgi:signal transduction histidine kinase
MRGHVRLLLLLDLAAVGACVAVLLIAAGVPLAARGILRPSALVALAASAALAGVALGVALLYRSIARPVDRILSAATRLGSVEGMLPILQPGEEPSSHGLLGAAVAFERLAAALGEERARLASKVVELERSNAQLAQVRESLLRSEKLATVGQLAAGVAHEVGNPLGAIGGYASLARARLAGSGGDPEVIDWIERIETEVRRIDRIVRELLDFARPSPVAPGPVAIGVAIEAAVRLARVQRRFQAVDVELDVPPDLPPVRGAEGQLAQLFLNLLLNAGDAMGGAGRVRIRARPEAGAVAVAVSDSGPGIPPGDLPRVFDPFFTTKPPGEGTGLGLAVCHGIAESFGGEVSVANGEGGGAVFTLRLPVAAPTGRSGLGPGPA